MGVRRFPQNPIIRPGMDARVGKNINGPSLIRVPEWIRAPLGHYYLYFAHHRGTFIRLAYADRLEGPWRVHSPGVLDLDETPFEDHIASPDVHVDGRDRRIRMYFHGGHAPDVHDPFDAMGKRYPVLGRQRSMVAVSNDGLSFACGNEIVGTSYLRAFDWNGRTYGLCMPGIFVRSRDPVRGFEAGPVLFTPDMRHSAVRVREGRLTVFYSNAGDCPESILRGEIDLAQDWMAWRAEDAGVVLAPETECEGAHLPLAPSRRGAAREPVRQVRDPCVYEGGERTFLLYTVAGEQGIAIAELPG